jgi:hypothetical protein
MRLNDNGCFERIKKPKVKKPKGKPLEKSQVFMYVKDIFADTIAEYKFLEDRKFKFDWFIPSKNCAIEYEGIFSGISRHTSIVGYNNDCEKYTLASLKGYKVIRITAMTTWEQLKEYLEKLK